MQGGVSVRGASRARLWNGRAPGDERVTREKTIATRSAREGHERVGGADRMTRENARMTREKQERRARAADGPRPHATPPIMARGHDDRVRPAPRIERATRPQ